MHIIQLCPTSALQFCVRIGHAALILWQRVSYKVFYNFYEVRVSGFIYVEIRFEHENNSRMQIVVSYVFIF